MYSSLMLCAFFEQRMRGGASAGARELLAALFEPFWSSVAKTKTTTTGETETTRRRVGGRTSSGSHWRVRESWTRRAERDGTSDALALLEFRMNRLCKLMTVCDCWPSSVGKHLAHWIDSHVHLAIEVETRGSGPTPPSTSETTTARWLSLVDWRRVDPEDVVAMREAIAGNAARLSRSTKNGKKTSRAPTYGRLIESVTACKTMGTVLRQFAVDDATRETTCAAIVRCVLGYDAHRADFALRVATHRFLSDGPRAACERLIEACDRGASATIFVAFREFVVRNVVSDVDAFAHFSRTSRWNAYASNAIHAAETVRVRLRDRVSRDHGETTTPPTMESFLVSNDEESIALIRNCKKVPGPVVRPVDRVVSVAETCRLVRRTRNRANRTQTPGGTDTFDDAGGTIASILAKIDDRDLHASVDPSAYLNDALRTSRSRETFVEIARASRKSVHAVRTIVEREIESLDFSYASDALELVKHFSSVRLHALPASIAERQRDAVRRHATNVGRDEAEVFRRRGEIVWCAGCRKVKNFVVSSDARGSNNHMASGYARVCHVGDDIVCDEKRTHPCCRAIPLRRTVALDATRSRCVQLFGTTYVVTTCCGKLAILSHVTCTTDGVFTCGECAKRHALVAASTSEARGNDDDDDESRGKKTTVKTCRYCSEIVGAHVKGSFTGKFEEEDGVVVVHAFCKRHTRPFMRREFEPMNLSDVLREIPKTVKTR